MAVSYSISVNDREFSGAVRAEAVGEQEHDRVARLDLSPAHVERGRSGVESSMKTGSSPSLSQISIAAFRYSRSAPLALLMKTRVRSTIDLAGG